MKIIEAVNVRKQYQDFVALNDVSFSVDKGTIFGLLGPNGAGKTTFIRTLTQITAPDSGYITFNGEKLQRRHIAEIGYLPEERGLYKKMKVGDQAMYLAQLKGLDKITAATELKKWFEKFEISSWWNKKVEELSKGMAQKIQFITTVIHHPKLLIFDEPFSGFDPVNVNILKNEIIKLKDDGATIIFSTHNMASVEEICDSIVLINHANIVLDGKVEDIKKQFCSDVYSFEVDLFDNYDSIIADNIISKSIDHSLGPNSISGTISMNNYFQYDETHHNSDDLSSCNSFIQDLMRIGNIMKFNKILPTMNEIFIKTVTNKE